MAAVEVQRIQVIALDEKKSYGPRALGYAMVLCGGLLWAVGGVCGQQLFQAHNVTANWLIPIRILTAGSCLLLYSFFKYSPAAVFAIWKDRKDSKDLLLFLVFGSVASQYTYYTCIQYSNAAFATVLSYMFPAVILLYNMIHTRRAPRAFEFISVLLVTLGAITCATHWNFSAMPISALALIIGIAAAVTAAYHTVKPQRLLRKYALTAIMGWAMTIGGGLLFLICRPWRMEVAVNTELVLLMSVIILGGTILAFSFFQGGVRIIGSLAGSILAAVEPIGAIVLTALLLRVPFTALDLLGFVLILATIPIIALGQNREAKEALRAAQRAQE